ncbi:hypothetical protein ACTOS9_21775 (plasmid) [Bacillus subtilis]|uniref:Uncharacterized protein n=1 Tax=Bacillus subtilis TaxID=1423 RepID=A0A8I1WGG2_BACIU|nr:hypothetical protein [Bacillus subtilis]MBO3796472.1 hypothetical protein [Bacillus subtilis]WEY82933.1 hypothetical protein P5633_00005 [Bacillus subtilis]
MTAAELAVILGVFLTTLHIFEKLLTLEKMLKERKTKKIKRLLKSTKRKKNNRQVKPKIHCD